MLKCAFHEVLFATTAAKALKFSVENTCAGGVVRNPANSFASFQLLYCLS